MKTQKQKDEHRVASTKILGSVKRQLQEMARADRRTLSAYIAMILEGHVAAHYQKWKNHRL